MIEKTFVKKSGGKDIYTFSFKNKNGLTMTVSNYGATLTSLLVPDKNGNFADVVLGMDTIEEYEAGHPYMGSTVGRFANRIGGPCFSLNGKEYPLTPTDDGYQLHGGVDNFSKKVWDYNIEGDSLLLTYVSPDGEEGYPAELTAKVCYQLTDDDAVDITYSATSNDDTIVNLTNHSYFNLNGAKDTVLEQIVSINANSFTLADESLVTTGEIVPVEGTPLDFRSPHRIGERINDTSFETIKLCGGYDSNFVLNGEGFRQAATLYDEASGRYMEAFTDQPGMQMYTSNSLEKGWKGKNGLSYGPYYAVCFEAQAFPDAPNKPNFPSAVLKKGDEYTQHTRYAFSIK